MHIALPKSNRILLLGLLALCLPALSACTDDSARCPSGTLRVFEFCVETRDGGGAGGLANGDSTGFVRDGRADGDDASIDAGGRDAGVDAGACVAPETCNGLDDDCDGKVDEGLLVALSLSTQTWRATPSMSSSTQRGLSSLLPRAAGGAWLLSKVLGPDPAASTAESGASSLSAVRLDADNLAVAAAQTGLLPSSRSYLATSDGSYVAVIFHAPDADGDPIDEDNDGNGTTQLVLWKDDGSGLLVQQGDARTVFARQADMSGISLHQTAGGEARILVAYSDATDNTGNATGLLAPHVHAFGYDSQVGQLYEVRAPTPLVRAGEPAADAGATVRIVRRPCGPGWIIGYFEPPSAQAGASLATREVFLRGVSIDGELAPETLWRSGPGFSFQGLGVHESCEVGAARLLLVLGDTSATAFAYELSWSEVAPVTEAGAGDTQGSVGAAILTKTLPGAVQPAQVARRGGLWFVTPRGTGVSVEGVLEVDPTSAGPVRTIGLPDALLSIGPAAAKHVRDVNMYFAPLAGLSGVSDGLLVTYANATSDPSTSPLGADTAAVTYKLACPGP